MRNCGLALALLSVAKSSGLHPCAGPAQNMSKTWFAHRDTEWLDSAQAATPSGSPGWVRNVQSVSAQDMDNGVSPCFTQFKGPARFMNAQRKRAYKALMRAQFPL